LLRSPGRSHDLAQRPPTGAVFPLGEPVVAARTNGRPSWVVGL
jgi:hypothetical protein